MSIFNVLRLLVYSPNVAFCQWGLTLTNLLRINTSSQWHQSFHCSYRRSDPGIFQVQWLIATLIRSCLFIRFLGWAQNFNFNFNFNFTEIPPTDAIGFVLGVDDINFIDEERSLQHFWKSRRKWWWGWPKIWTTTGAYLGSLEVTTRKLADQNEWSRENHFLQKRLQPPIFTGLPQANYSVIKCERGCLLRRKITKLRNSCPEDIACVLCFPRVCQATEGSILGRSEDCLCCHFKLLSSAVGQLEEFIVENFRVKLSEWLQLVFFYRRLFSYTDEFNKCGIGEVKWFF